MCVHSENRDIGYSGSEWFRETSDDHDWDDALGASFWSVRKRGRKVKHFVMGTAGHGGHGKTALIHALTGSISQPDDPPSGFVRMRFDETLLDIIDLPGSEGLAAVATGMADADMALLVVAADEGVQAQTVEHLRVLSLLDITRYIVVLTKIDLADEETLAAAREGVRGLYSAWGLPGGTPVVEVSALTGDGLERLLETVVDQCARMPVRRSDRPFYMHVARMLTEAGGMAAMGTVREGTLRPGEEIMLCPGGEVARVCGLESGGMPLKLACAGQRVTVRLDPVGGVPGEGSALSAVLPGPAAGPMDVRLIVLPECARPVEHGMRLWLYVGAARVSCVAAMPKEGRLCPGESGYGQLVPETPVPALPGERFILRFPTGEGLAGGGVILDAHAPVRGREGWRAASARMSCFEYGGKDGRLHWEASARLCTEGMLRERFARWSDGEFRRTRDALLAKGLLVRAGELLLGAQLAGTLKGELISQLTNHHTRQPLEAGMPLEEAKRICPGGLLELCVRDGTVRLDGCCVSLPLFDPRNTRRFWQLAPALLELYKQSGPMERWELVELSGLPERDAELAVALLEQDGRLEFPSSGARMESKLDRMVMG